jgi:hypothetical protein
MVAMGLGYGAWFLMGYAVAALSTWTIGIAPSAGRVGEHLFVWDRWCW